jgi:hypothetical protein
MGEGRTGGMEERMKIRWVKERKCGKEERMKRKDE